MSKNTYWITSTNGIHGQVEGTEERDRWTPLGWFTVDEPKATDFVWMRKDGIENPAQFAYGAAPTWEAMGWNFSAPPEPYDVTKDPALFDQQPVVKKPAPRKQAPAAKATTGTASGQSLNLPEQETTTTTGPAAGTDKN